MVAGKKLKPKTGLIPFLNKPRFLRVNMQYKPFENTLGKGEIARNEQFLLFPKCFLYNTECRLK